MLECPIKSDVVKSDVVTLELTQLGMHSLIVIWIGMSMLISVASYAEDSKDLDMADRIYRKYEERKKHTRATQEQHQQRRQSKSDSVVKTHRDDDRDIDRSDRKDAREIEKLLRQVFDSKRNNASDEEPVPQEQNHQYRMRSEQKRGMEDSEDEFAVRGPQRQGPQRAASVSLDQAVNIVRRNTDGKVLSAKSSGNKHKIKVLIDGKRVRTYVVDADTGEIY